MIGKTLPGLSPAFPLGCVIHIDRGIMNFTRYRRPSAFLLLTVAVVLGVAAVAGLESGDEGALILLLRLREHVLLLGWLTLGALTGAVLLGLAKASLRVPLAAMLLVIGVPTLLIGGWASAFGGSDETVKTESAPRRGDRQLVVMARSGILDPVWCVYVHQGNPPMERRWTVGCFNGDSAANALSDTAWTAPDRIRMTTEGGVDHYVTIAPDGRPDRIVSVS
ncbi:hypothetical protein [Streptomyces exfoliatus]|uniref:hypothetical protein n=1 Tax=Streptomyces exfoliatus TaxID=1905 RepID=UPI0004C6CF03|nr:hypothetical protein [Streptomyces exfoliatus]